MSEITPKFKVGQTITHISGQTYPFYIARIDGGLYISENGATISFGRQDDWELVQESANIDDCNLVNADEVRDDFVREVYRILDADPTNDRANQIIDVFDNLPTVNRVEDMPKIWHDSNEDPGDNERSCLEIFDDDSSCIHPASYYKHLSDKPVTWAYVDELVKLSNVVKIGKDWKEKKVDENLESQIDDYLKLYWGNKKEESLHPFLKKMAIHFAEWQKQKDESKVLTEEQCRKIRDDAFELGKDAMKQQMEAYRIEHCKSITNEQAELEDNFVSSHVEKNNRIPTFIDAIEYGIEYGKQQMMAKAVDVTVHIDAGGYPYIPQVELYDYDKDIPLAKEGDKYKVILTKEN